MAIINIIKTIDSAHGTTNVHGHTFKIEIAFEGKLVDDMVEGIDFNEIKIPINEVIEKLDKKYLNDILQTRATVENIAIYIIKNLKQFNSLYAVTVWEGQDRYAKIFAEEVL